MKYILLCYHEEKVWDQISEAEQQQIMAEVGAHVAQLQASGNYLTSAPLHPTSTATTVRIRDGKRLVTDGPFAETKEQLGGFYLIEARDLDEAIGIAARHPPVRWGCPMEIRPVREIPGLTARSTS